jgi:hypothetical protein
MDRFRSSGSYFILFIVFLNTYRHRLAGLIAAYVWPVAIAAFLKPATLNPSALLRIAQPGIIRSGRRSMAGL